MHIFTFLSLPFFFVTHALSAQFILAGHHDVNQYFIDIQPDTTIEAPHMLLPTYDMYAFDMNGDDVVDCELHVANFGGLGSHSYFCYIEPKNNCEVAVSGTDSCFTQSNCGWLNGLVWVKGMVRAFEYGDPIDDSAAWADSSVHLSYGNYTDGCFYCYGNTFESSDTNYIGIRYFSSSDTVYGWIKVSGVNDITCTIEAFASTAATTSVVEAQLEKIIVQVYPNPASGQLQLEFGQAIPEHTILTIWDAVLRPMCRQEIESGVRLITRDISSFPNGIYYLSIETSRETKFSGRFAVNK